MENNSEQDIEIQLQEELHQLKKAIEYIQQAKISFAQSQQMLNSTQAKIEDRINANEIQIKDVQISILDCTKKIKMSAFESEQMLDSVQAKWAEMVSSNETLTQELHENIKKWTLQTKVSSMESQQMLDSTQTKWVEISALHKTLIQAFQTSILGMEDKSKNMQVDIENKFTNKFGAIEQDIGELRDNKPWITEINTLKNQLATQQKVVQTNTTDFDTQIDNLTRQLKSNKILNFILLAAILILFLVFINKG